MSSENGVVTLTGHVERYVEKSAAEKAVRRFNNVMAIAEEIEVLLPFSAKHGDEEIASEAVNRLKWDSTIPSGAIKAKVEKGWVTLTGEVEWHSQKAAAMNDIRGLWGVVGVSDQITIKPKPNATAIRGGIMVALDRSWFDPATINVTTEGGKLNLTGKVNFWYERDEAADTAWTAPDTTSVENHISVS